MNALVHAPTPPSTVAPARAEAALTTMRAMVHDQYGPFEGLQMRDIARPAIQPNQVLIRVRAAGLQVGDCFSVRGAPYGMRLVTGLLRPKYGVPGFDVAGEVAAVGAMVTQFQIGDAVFGVGHGTCAEYVAVDAGTLAPKPANLSFVAAAATPVAALAALHGLRDVAKVQPGQRVLINGASGGVGSFAVQIAKALGAHVTGVCGTGNVEMVRALGADAVIDYTKEDFTAGSARYDVIFDNVENRSLADRRRVLAPSGTLLFNSGTGAAGFALYARLIAPLLLAPFVRHNLRRFLSKPNQADLIALKGMIEGGAIQPAIDRTYALPELAIALSHIEGGHARGKVVVSV